jgi:hypothetical protein
MGTPLRIVERQPWEARAAGMMWRYPAGDESGRECWWIILPHTHPDLRSPGHPSHINFLTTQRAADPPHGMWAITGTAPRITVKPSIDCLRHVRKLVDGKMTSVREGSYWHGSITDGVMEP